MSLPPMLLLLAAAQAQDPLVDGTCVLDEAARLQALDQARATETEHERVRALLAGRSVLIALDEADVADVDSCRAYLGAVLSGDRGRMDQALLAARAGGAVDAEGQPVIVAPVVAVEEALAGAPDPTTPEGRALLRYQGLVAGLGGCVLGQGTMTTLVEAWASAPDLNAASWAVTVGPEAMLHPRRFARWAASVEEGGVLPEEAGPSRDRSPLADYSHDEEDLAAARQAVATWNAWLRAQLDLSEAQVAEVEMEVAAHHSPPVLDQGTQSRQGSNPRVDQLPACP